jgi:hypothetical protein
LGDLGSGFGLARKPAFAATNEFFLSDEFRYRRIDMAEQGAERFSSQKSDEGVAFRCYIDAEGMDVIDAWYCLQPEALRSVVDGVIERLQSTRREWWRRKTWAALGKGRQDTCKGLEEIRLDFEGIAYRVFGFYDANENAFTLLLPIIKSEDPDYSKSCPESQNRRVIVRNEKSRTRLCRFPKAESAI